MRKLKFNLIIINELRNVMENCVSFFWLFVLSQLGRG